jgi:hypothetical protein
MENLKKYSDFLFEGKGISPSIYADLQKYFETSGKHTYNGAKEFLSKSKKKWNLTEEDFVEAAIEFKNKK